MADGGLWSESRRSASRLRVDGIRFKARLFSAPAVDLTGVLSISGGLIVLLRTAKSRQAGCRILRRTENWHGRCLLCKVRRDSSLIVFSQRINQAKSPLKQMSEMTLFLWYRRNSDNDTTIRVVAKFRFPCGRLISMPALSEGTSAFRVSRSESGAGFRIQGALTFWSFPELPVQAR